MENLPPVYYYLVRTMYAGCLIATPILMHINYLWSHRLFNIKPAYASLYDLLIVVLPFIFVYDLYTAITFSDWSHSLAQSIVHSLTTGFIAGYLMGRVYNGEINNIFMLVMHWIIVIECISLALAAILIW